MISTFIAWALYCFLSFLPLICFNAFSAGTSIRRLQVQILLESICLCSSKTYLKMYPVSFLCGLLHDIYRKKVVSLYGASPYWLFPGCIVTWAWSLAEGQFMVSWLLTGAPEQRYWQNRETADIGLVSWVGRAPARQSRGCRFKSCSSQFVFLFIQNLSKNVPSYSFPCGSLHDI